MITPGMRRLKVSWPSRMMKNVQPTALPRQHTPRAAFLAVGSLMVAFTIARWPIMVPIMPKK